MPAVQTVLSAAIVVTLLTSAAIVAGWGGQRVAGPRPLSLLGFMALLFTSGLDVGLVMLPLTEFPLYAREPEYAFANPLAIAFGSWGFLVWGFYFLTTFYFLVVEPRLRLFEIPAVKAVNSVVIATALDIGAYFAALPRFVLPMSDYHAFYLFWWFSWSIMIGQFVARFVGPMRTWHLAAALLVIPSIPIAAWFSVLYFYFRQQLTVPPALTMAMVAVGVLFVVNSLDSLIRLYSDNLNLTTRRLGTPAYVAGHWLLMCGLVLAFQLTPLRIEWIGLVVIGLYAAIYGLLIRHRGRLTTPNFLLPL